MNENKRLMKSSSVRMNVALNAIRNVVGVLFPLIIFPYVSRVLGTDVIGELSYSRSIVNYFAYIAALGVNSYAIREGSKIVADKDKEVRFVSEIFTTNLATTLISYVLLFLVVSTFDTKANTTYIFIYGLTIMFTTVGVEWLNSIYENYLYITIRTIIVQTLSLVLIFVFVRNNDDAGKYALITVLATGVTSAMNNFYCRRLCKFRICLKYDIVSHLKKMLVFFANNLAILIYVNSDTTMLGYMAGSTAVGLYYAAVKIYTIPKNMIASMYLATIPRLTKYLDDEEKYTNLLNKIVGGLLLLMLPAVTGLFLLAKPIILVISGSEFVLAASSLKLLSVALLFAIIGGVVTSCILIPFGLEKVVLISTLASAFINVFLNLFLIPIFKQNGAAFTTVVAEMSVPIIAILLSKNKLPFKILNASCLKYIKQSAIGGILTIFVIVITNKLISNEFLQIIISVVATLGLYGVFLIIVKNEFAIQALHVLKAKLLHERKLKK